MAKDLKKHVNPTAAEITERIKAQLCRHDREPFREMLADAVQAKPTVKQWRKMAGRDPEKYARSIRTMSQTAGYTDRTESVSYSVNMVEIINMCVARFGADNTQKILESIGAPTSLAKLPIDTVIEGSRIADSNNPLGADSGKHETDGADTRRRQSARD